MQSISLLVIRYLLQDGLKAAASRKDPQYGICLKLSNFRIFSFSVNTEKFALLKHKTSPFNSYRLYVAKRFLEKYSPKCLIRTIQNTLVDHKSWGFLFL